MKVLSLIALIFAACVYFVNAQYSPTTLTSGTQVTGISTSSTNTVCNYYSLTVPANTGAVKIDLTSTSTNFVSITAGFNYFPDADRDTTTNGYSYDFYDNNVINGGAARYHLCTYDPNSVPGTSASFPSTSLTGCAAWVPNLHLGGKVYICLSSYSSSTATTGTSLTATNVPLVSTTAVGISGTSVPVAAASTSALYTVTPYAFSIPSNSTGISVVTSSSSTVIQGPGLYSNAYTTGNSISLGGYVIGSTVYFMVIQSSTSAQTFTFTNTFSSCTSGQYMISSSSSCYNVTTLTSGTGQALTYSSSGYQLFQITAPTTVPTNKFYMLTIATTNTFLGTVYVQARSFQSLDTTPKAYGTFQNTYGGQSLVSGTQTYTYHYLYPGQVYNIVLYSSASSTTTTLTATVAAETGTQVVVGTSTTAATSTSSSAASYVTLNPFTVTGSNGYLIKLTSTGLTSGTVNTQGLQIVSSDLTTPYVTTGLKTSSSNLYTIYVPANTLTSGSYFLVNLPSGTTGRTVTFTTTSPSSSASISGPAITFLIAILTFVLLALN